MSASLYKMAQISLERLNSIDKLKYPSHTLDDYYDILHQLMESLSSLKGIKFSGDSAHKELIDWIGEECCLSKIEISFLQKIRNYRNKISYEGYFIQSSFIEQNDKKITYLIKKIDKEIRRLV